MRYDIEIRQTHDASGRPVPGVFEHALPERLGSDRALGEVYRFLRDLEPVRTARPGEYGYRDPARGSGTLVVHGLGWQGLARLEERVQHHELERAIGLRDPLLWDRQALGSERIWRNPWVGTVFGALVLLAGFATIVWVLSLRDEPGRDPATVWLGVFFGIIFVLLGATLGILHGRRIRWWMRARAAVKAAGLPMPTDLDLSS